MKKIFVFISILIASFCIPFSSYTFAQSSEATYSLTSTGSDSTSISTYENNSPEMATGLRSSGLIWVVVGVILIILFGLIFYLNSIDRKLKKLEQEITNYKH